MAFACRCSAFSFIIYPGTSLTIPNHPGLTENGEAEKLRGEVFTHNGMIINNHSVGGQCLLAI